MRFIPPSLQAWLGHWTDQIHLVEVLIRQVQDGYELRHASDASKFRDELKHLALEELRIWVQTTETGSFRPNKLAPNLRRGWICTVGTDFLLGEALRHLYPGAIADWYAEQMEHSARSFREFFGRQTGMYRAVRQISDTEAARAVTANCAPEFCRRRRIWEAPGLSADRLEDTSAIPCFEPCGTMMEMARRAAKSEQGPAISISWSRDDLTSIQEALKRLMEARSENVREGDLASPINPRRVRWTLQKINLLVAAIPSGNQTSE